MKTLIVAVILMAAGGKKEDVTGWFGGGRCWWESLELGMGIHTRVEAGGAWSEAKVRG